MSRRRGAATAAALALFAAFVAASPARAQHVEAHASLTLTGAYTRSSGDDPAATAQTFAGPSIALSPVLLMLLDTPRTEHTLGYSLSLSAPLLRGPTVASASIQMANRLTYTGRYALDELTSMTFGAAFTESPLDAFVPSQDATAAPIQTVPAGTADLIAVTANEGVSRLVADSTSISQAAAFAYGAPLLATGAAAGRTYSGQNTLGWARTFLYNTVGMTVTNQASRFTVDRGVPATTVWVNTLSLDYVHLFTESLTATITPGVTVTLSPAASRSTLVEPSGTATLRYDHRYAAAALTFAHLAEPNLATSIMTFNDTATLRFVVPLGLTGLVAAGTFGYAHMTPIDPPPSAPQQHAANVLLSDGALDYYPASAKCFSVGFRGQVVRQLVASDAASSLTRYTLALHLTVAYPSAEATALRPALAPIFAVRAPTASEIVSSDRIRAGEWAP
jgi:hypothetical protein